MIPTINRRLSACLVMMLCAMANAQALASRLALVSVPRAEVVTGGDVLLAASSGDLRFALADGTDLSADKFANPAGGSWYLVSGLPEATATIVAHEGRAEVDRLTLHNISSDGPVISGPRETPFFCQTQSFEIGPGLGTLPAARTPSCATRTRFDTLLRRADGSFEAVRQDQSATVSVTAPAVEGSAIDTAGGAQAVGAAALVRVETGVIDRAIYQIAMPVDKIDQAVTPGSTSRAWNHKLIYKFGGGCRGGWYRQGATTAGVLDADLLAQGYAVVSASLNVFGNNCNDLLGSEVMMMVREHFIEAYGPPQYTLGFGCSGGSYQSLQTADNYPGLLDGVLIGCTFPEVGLATLTNLFDARLLENYFANVAASSATKSVAAGEVEVIGEIIAPAGTATPAAPAASVLRAPPVRADTAVELIRWSDAQILAVTGYASINNLHQSAVGAARIDATPRTERKSAEFDAAVPEIARYRAVGQRDGARPTLFDHTVNVYGKDAATGFARWALDNRGVQYGLAALNKGEISLTQFIDLNQKIGGMDREGNLTSARTKHDAAATQVAYSSGRILSARGGLRTIPIVDYRAWADRLDKGDIHMAYHSQTLRTRLRQATNDSDHPASGHPASDHPASDHTVSSSVALPNAPLPNEAWLIEDGSCAACELFSLKSAVLQLALQGMDAWLLGIAAAKANAAAQASAAASASATSPSASSAADVIAQLAASRPASLADACWINGRKVEITRDGVGPCAERFPAYGFPRLVAGASMANDIVACDRRPVSIVDYPDASPAEFADLNDIFADGVCDWSRPGEAHVAYAGTWQSFGPVRVEGDIVVPPPNATSEHAP